jgi:16S rRNA (uracil1498-N3)-methyltransferase
MSVDWRAPWFYYAGVLNAGAVVQLEDEEARHISGARRLEPGAGICLFDGCGTVAYGTISELGARGRRVAVTLQQLAVHAPPAPAVHLVCALPKGDRQAVMIDMATQLGINSFTPLLTGHSVVKPGANAAQRLQRIAIEACKQSRQAHVPSFHEPVELGTYVHGTEDAHWIAHPGGRRLREVLATDAPFTGGLRIMIGPEGGFTAAEAEAAVARGATMVDLGSTILRIETAAVMMTAAIRTWYGNRSA